MNNRPVFIIGMMGSGKSTKGKKLAKLLDYQFIDLDLEIEKQVGTSITEIFKTKEEHNFRALETQILKELSKPNTLISCGGGTPCFNNNIEMLKKTGHVVYFKASNEALVLRLINAKATRPLIQNLNSDEVLVKLNTLLSERVMFYDQADLIVEALNLSPIRLKELTESIKSLSN
jgi:shikimate kinase|tara:strand:+ start:228 stop:752 length:525 start_codon:yes stop_codon:yes gene_type:complete